MQIIDNEELCIIWWIAGEVYIIKGVRKKYINFTLFYKKIFYPVSSRENLGVNGWTGAFP